MKHELPSELEGADWLLKQWGLWVFSEPIGTDCSSSSYGPGDAETTTLTDDQAMSIDKAIAGMEWGLKWAIKKHYLAKIDVNEAVLMRAIRVFDVRHSELAEMPARGRLLTRGRT